MYLPYIINQVSTEYVWKQWTLHFFACFKWNLVFDSVIIDKNQIKKLEDLKVALRKIKSPEILRDLTFSSLKVFLSKNNSECDHFFVKKFRIPKKIRILGVFCGININFWQDMFNFVKSNPKSGEESKVKNIFSGFAFTEDEFLSGIINWRKYVCEAHCLKPMSHFYTPWKRIHIVFQTFSLAWNVWRFSCRSVAIMLFYV